MAVLFFALAVLIFWVWILYRDAVLLEPDLQMIPLNFSETDGIARNAQVVSFNVPLPQGALFYLNGNVRITDELGSPVVAQFAVVNRWHGLVTDFSKSIKFVRVIMPITLAANTEKIYQLEYGQNLPGPFVLPSSPLTVQQTTNILNINTGVAQYVLDSQSFDLFKSIAVNGQPFLTMGPNDGVAVTTDGVVRLLQSVNPTSTQMVVTDTRPFSAGETVDIAFSSPIVFTGIEQNTGTNTGGKQGNSYFLLRPGVSFVVGDQIVISKGTSREETVTITSLQTCDDPTQYQPNDGLCIYVSSNLQFDHSKHDSVDHSAVFTAVIGNIVDLNTMTLTSSPLRAIGSGARVMRLGGGSIQTFVSGQTPPTTFVVEENGPVRASIYFEGKFRNPSGQDLLNYQGYLRFFVGKLYVEVEIVRGNGNTYGNDPNQKNNDRYIRSQTVRIPFGEIASTAVFDTSDSETKTLSEYSTQLSSGNARQYVFMDLPPSSFNILNPTGEQTNLDILDNFYGDVSLNGVSQISYGGEGVSPEYHPYGIVSLKNSAGTKSLTVGVRDYWQRFSKALTADSSGLTIELITPDRVYGPLKEYGAHVDSAGRKRYNQQAGTRERELFLIYPSISNQPFSAVRDEIRGVLHHPIVPEYIQQVYDTKALFQYPYVLRKDLAAQMPNLSPAMQGTINLWEQWVNVLTDRNAATLTLPQYVRASWYEMQYTRGAEFGDTESYGFNYGAYTWSDGQTTEYDMLGKVILQYLRTGNKNLLKFARPIADSRTFYRTYWRDDYSSDPYYTYLGEQYEKGYRHTDYQPGQDSHRWYVGLADACVIFDDPMYCKYLKKWGDEYFLTPNSQSATYSWSYGCSTTPRAHGWTLKGGMALYNLFGDPAYLNKVDQVIAQYDACDRAQDATGLGFGFIFGDNIYTLGIENSGNVWMHGILFDAVGDRLILAPNAPQEVRNFAKRAADFFTNANNDLRTNPYGTPWVYGPAPTPANPNLINPYQVCNDYSMTPDANSVLGGCNSNARSKTAMAYGFSALTKIYIGLQSYSEHREIWADYAREFAEIYIKFANAGGGPLDRYDSTQYGPVSARITAYPGTIYKTMSYMYDLVAPVFYNEIFVRVDCSALGGMECASNQVCTVPTQPARDTLFCCVPASSCIADVNPPNIVGTIIPNFSLHISITSFTLQFTTNEQSSCRYDTSANGANLDYNTMNPANTFTTSDGLIHQKLFNSFNGVSFPLSPAVYPNGLSMSFYISCSDNPMPGNIISPPLLRTVVINGPDTTPPQIFVSSIIPQSDSVSFVWTTDELATTQVSAQAGTSAPIYSQDLTLTNSHTATLNGLLPSTVYSYIITSADFDGNTNTKSGSFITSPADINVAFNVLDSTPGNAGMAAIFQEPSKSHYYAPGCAVGYLGSFDIRCLLWFDLSSLPTSIVNVAANLHLEIGSVSPSGTQIRNIEIYPLTRAFGFSSWPPPYSSGGGGNNVGTSATSGQADWIHALHSPIVSTANSWITPGGDYLASSLISHSFSTSVGNNLDIDVTSFVNSWIVDPSQNNGMLLRLAGTPNVGFEVGAWSASVPTLTVTGQTVSPTICTASTSVACNTGQLGNCAAGAQTCVNGQWSFCAPISPSCNSQIPSAPSGLQAGLI